MNTIGNSASSFSASLGTAVNVASTPSANPLKVVNGNAKLTYDEVIMLKLYHHWVGMQQTELSQRFGISPTGVNYILKKRSYKHVVLNHMTKIPEQFHIETNGIYRGKKFKGHQ